MRTSEILLEWKQYGGGAYGWLKERTGRGGSGHKATNQSVCRSRTANARANSLLHRVLYGGDSAG
jgi:hypothetical protein